MLTACSACGGHSSDTPALARADAQPLAALAHKIAGEGACAQRRDIKALQQRAVRLVNARRVPSALQDTLVSGVNALAADTPPCVPAVPVQPAPRPSPPVVFAPHPHGHGHEHKPPKHHGHEHGKHD